MKQPNEKESLVLEMFKQRIENDSFDEIDITAFFIFLRSLLEKEDKSQYKNLYDLCDFVAHRERDKGKTQQGIQEAINNRYQTKKDSKQVCGYNGITDKEWKEEWNTLGTALDIDVSETVLKNISLCVLSMLQNSTFYNSKLEPSKKIAIFQILQGKNSLSVCSTEGAPHSPYVCYFIVDDLQFTKRYSSGLIEDPIFAIREGSSLRLINNNKEYVI